MINTIAKIFIASIFLVTISSCERNKCKNTTCISGLVCYPGTGQCLCPDGYEGPDCQTLSFQKYQNNYMASGGCNEFGSFYTYGSSAGGQYPVNYITFSNFFNTGYPLLVEILNTDPNNLGSSLFVPSQSMGAITISNSNGRLSSNTNGVKEVILDLSYSDGSGNYQCEMLLYQN